MSSAAAVGRLPTWLALDALGVLEGCRRGTSLQLDDTYFDGQLAALRSVVGNPSAGRQRQLRRSKAAYAALQVEVDSLTEPALRDASARFRQGLQGIPEVDFLKREFPGTCFVVPEWLRLGERLEYGARIYFFRDGDAPAPDEIIDSNVEAVVEETPEAHARLVGRLHGYPDCCVDHYQDRTPGEPSPEARSVDPLAGRVADDLLDGTADPSVSIDDLLVDFFDDSHAYVFFAREFFPEPGCRTARERGTEIYEALADRVPEGLVRDHFRLNYGWNYLVAWTLGERGTRRPSPGCLGREHLLSYLQLAVTT